jgi:hypothetical protein
MQVFLVQPPHAWIGAACSGPNSSSWIGVSCSEGRVVGLKLSEFKNLITGGTFLSTAWTF